MGGEEASTYYKSGSEEIATETALTLRKLEKRNKLTQNSKRLVIALVGLPARGKSFVSRKLQSFLTWYGHECQIFNVGKYRREAHKQSTAQAQAQSLEGQESLTQEAKDERIKVGACDANFFDANNKEGNAIRELAASLALKDMLKWLDGDDQDEDDEEEPQQQVPSLPQDNNSVHFSIHTDGSNNNNNNTTQSENRNGNRRRRSRLLRRSSSATSAGRGGGEYDIVDALTSGKLETDRIAIFDATNSTAKRRQWLLEECTSSEKRAGKPTGIVFVESICDDEELLHQNYLFKVSTSPDFKGMSQQDAIADLKRRVAKYEEQYETLSDDNQSYIKIFNLSSKLLVNHIYGRMAKVIVPALMSWNVGVRPIFLCRAGETFESPITTDTEDLSQGSGSNNNNNNDKQQQQPYGVGFSPTGISLDFSMSSIMKRSTRKSKRGRLSPSGIEFRKNLADFIEKESMRFMDRRAKISYNPDLYTGTSKTGLLTYCDESTGQPTPFPCTIFTSTMPRAAETAMFEKYKIPLDAISNLNPLDKGDFAGMELEEIAAFDPAWYDKLVRDPYLTRFPGGECYRDLIMRLQSVIIDMEQQVAPVLVVSHISVLQALIAYFRKSPVDQCMNIEVPMHTVLKFTPSRGGGWRETRHPLGMGVLGHITPVQSVSELSILTEGDPRVTPIWGDHLDRN